MSRVSRLLPADVGAYVTKHSRAEDKVLRDLADRTARLGDDATMQVPREEGAFLTVITRALRARTAIEIGTFTGYSATCIARGLEEGGHLLCLDSSNEWTAMAEKAWQQAGLLDNIELRVGLAVDALRALAEEGAPPVDLAFIDADKVAYQDYLELLFPLAHPGSLFLFDNTLQRGLVAAAAAPGEDEDITAMRTFNQALLADARFETVLLPLADGVTLAHVL